MIEKEGRQKKSPEGSTDKKYSLIERNGHCIRFVKESPLSQENIKFFTQDIASEIKDPKDWAFFVGGLGLNQVTKNPITEYAMRNNITLVDPVLPHSSPAILNRYVNSKNGTPEKADFFRNYMSRYYCEYLPGNEDSIAIELGLWSGKNVIERAANSLKSQDRLGKKKYMEKVDEIMLEIKPVSEAVNTQMLDFYLEFYKKPNIAMSLNEARENILNIKKEDIPGDLVLRSRDCYDILKINQNNLVLYLDLKEKQIENKNKKKDIFSLFKKIF